MGSHGKQRQKSRCKRNAQRDADPVQHRPSRPLSLCQLEIDDLQLFRNRFQIIRLRRGDRLSQQSADRRLQCLREGKQQVGIWDGKPRFPFRDRLPHDMQLDGKLRLGKSLCLSACS